MNACDFRGRFFVPSLPAPSGQNKTLLRIVLKPVSINATQSLCFRAEEWLFSRGHGFPKFLRECVDAGRITTRLAKGSWPNSARSPAADIPGPQRISQRGSAPRLGEATRAGAGQDKPAGIGSERQDG